MAQEIAPPKTKTRLVLSFIFAIAGIILLMSPEQYFDYQVNVAWTLLVVGVLSILYNLYCLKTGRKY
jgi:uncharacterized membrane protein HdeD (DUF308 family)